MLDLRSEVLIAVQQKVLTDGCDCLINGLIGWTCHLSLGEDVCRNLQEDLLILRQQLGEFEPMKCVEDNSHLIHLPVFMLKLNGQVDHGLDGPEAKLIVRLLGKGVLTDAEHGRDLSGEAVSRGKPLG